jgi:hypothetical protein
MKAYVEKIEGKNAMLKTENGSRIKIRNNSYRLGEELPVEESSSGVFSFAAATAVAAVFLVGLFLAAYLTPYYYISIDTNPSLMVHANIFERVVGIEPMNEEAEELFGGRSYNNMKVEDAVVDALSTIGAAGYFEGMSADVFLAPATRNEAKSKLLAAKLKETVELQVRRHGIDASIEADSVSYYLFKDAERLGVSPGKLHIIQNLLGLDIAGNIELTVKQLLEKLDLQK